MSGDDWPCRSPFYPVHAATPRHWDNFPVFVHSAMQYRDPLFTTCLNYLVHWSLDRGRDIPHGKLQIVSTRHGLEQLECDHCIAHTLANNSATHQHFR